MFYYYDITTGTYVGCGNEPTAPAGCEARTTAPEAKPKTNDEIVADISNYTQKRLDDFAGTRKYDGVDSVGKYKDLTDAEIATLAPAEQVIVSRYRSECRYLSLVTAQTWAVLENIYTAVMAGNRAAPSGYADVEPELPELAWPA